MAIVHAYFDESGKMGDHPVVTFTGVCVSQLKHKRFDESWNALLDKCGLKSLHMAEASRLRQNNGPVMRRHQTPDQRIDCLIPFADCINEHLDCGLIQAYDVRGFKSLTPKAKIGIGSPDDPHYLAFTRGLLEVVNYVHPDDRLSLICDDDEATAWGCYSHYRAVRKASDEIRVKIVALGFANDEYYPALQAADMLAFLSRLEAKRQFYGIKYLWNRLFRHLVSEQPEGRMQWFKMFADEKQLAGLGASLEKLKINRPPK